jgi:hypothetical protein
VEEQAQERDHGGSGYLIPPLTPAWMEFSVRTPEKNRQPFAGRFTQDKSLADFRDEFEKLIAQAP